MGPNQTRGDGWVEEVCIRSQIDKREPLEQVPCVHCDQAFQGTEYWVIRAPHQPRYQSRQLQAQGPEDAELKEWALREGVLIRSAGGSLVLLGQQKPTDTYPVHSTNVNTFLLADTAQRTLDDFECRRPRRRTSGGQGCSREGLRQGTVRWRSIKERSGG
ncbi:uncharacterized protein PV07_12609 [Cladophialophora immunda]|uniref:Uncharacterized protein n=1 Tax=Cladophialophora immunda TaxID=569365 RepID=A0A0D2BSI6_9EURO|nr:uncharacterized protein PV07_12609 [Cladophialophora immunda]KIW21993.1 hypothetical protein PV07_12609 [Cladophialophora immunda]